MNTRTNAREQGPVPLALPAGWQLAESMLPVESAGAPSVVGVRVVALDGRPAWLHVVTGEVGASVRRRLRTEQPALDALLHRVADVPGGAVLLPWLEYGDPKRGRPYVASARPGPTLADDLARGPLPNDDVVAALRDCAAALEVLHRHSRAHGLVSPASLHRDGDRIRLSAPLPPALGEIVALAGGTGHEPPEVLRGGEPGAAADVFSLASTAWTLLSGRPPFGAADDQLARLTAATPAPMTRPGVPPAMEAALVAALSPDPARRPDLPTLAQALHIVVQRADPGRQDTLAPTHPVTGEPDGQPLGSRYLLDALIGRGATGHVWRGHTREDGTPVAVKLLRSELAEDPEVVTRFMRERTALQGVQHPNLVAVRDLVAEGSALAIVMDLVDGPDLRSVLRRSRPSPRHAAAVLAQTAGALAAVHAAGFVHRDLKPENILVEGTGDSARARLTDFGLARGVESAVLTRNTQLVGTPAYIAPETVAGRPPGPGTDVYALGITGYELLAGRRPFAAGSTAALLRAHLDESPERPAEIDDAAWSVIAACLAKDPEIRPTASWLAAAWQDLADGLVPPAWTPEGQLPPDTRALPPSGLLDEPPAAVPPSSTVASTTPPTALPAEGLAHGTLATTAAHRPLAPRHAPPPVAHRNRRRLYLLVAAAIVVLGFGGGFAYVAVHDSAAKKPARTSSGYPLQPVVKASGAIPLVSWRLAPNLIDKDRTIVIVYRVDKNGTRTAISESLPAATATSLRTADLAPGQCFVVYAYYTTKAPSSDAPARRACLPQASASASRSSR